MAERSARRGVLEIIASASLTGTTGTTASFAPAAATQPAIGAARLFIGGIVLLLVLPFVGGSRATAVRLLRTPAGCIAGIAVALYQVTFFAGVARTGVAIGTLVAVGSGPVLVGCISWLVLGERPSAAWWMATAIGIVGLALLASDGIANADGDVAGALLALTAGLAYAAYTVAARRLLVRGAEPGEAMGAAFGGGMVLVLPVLFLAGPGWLATPRGAGVALWLGLATIGVAYVLFGRGLRVLPAGPVATLFLAEPLVATILGVVVLGETLAPAAIVGALLVVIGLVAQARVSSVTTPFD